MTRNLHELQRSSIQNDYELPNWNEEAQGGFYYSVTKLFYSENTFIHLKLFGFKLAKKNAS